MYNIRLHKCICVCARVCSEWRSPSRAPTLDSPTTWSSLKSESNGPMAPSFMTSVHLW